MISSFSRSPTLYFSEDYVLCLMELVASRCGDNLSTVFTEVSKLCNLYNCIQLCCCSYTCPINFHSMPFVEVTRVFCPADRWCATDTLRHGCQQCILPICGPPPDVSSFLPAFSVCMHVRSILGFQYWIPKEGPPAAYFYWTCILGLDPNQATHQSSWVDQFVQFWAQSFWISLRTSFALHSHFGLIIIFVYLVH